MSANKINVNFLSDQPLKFDEISRAKFGHEGIAETLKNIVLVCPTPFTIGLFGKWGTGKSSIANFLQEKLREEGIVVINFDVWKYEKDPLRRTFLQSVVKAFKDEKILKEDYSLEKEFYQTLTVTLEGESRFSWKRMKILFPYLILSYLVTIIVVTILRGIFDITTIAESLIIPVLLAILQDIKNVVVTDQRSITYKSIESPEQFEDRFKEILKYSKDKKVAIVIDNLDRCSHEKAIELLSTIKTFLEVRDEKDRGNCVFIIQCDDDAIKEHLENIYGKSNNLTKEAFAPDEFLRKFFNSFVRIPEFIDTELQGYTEALLKEIKAKKLDSPEVAHIITSAYRENPRQIKQFINTLLAHYFLVQEREEGEKPQIQPKGTITNNLGFLAKLLVIRQNFPRVYKKIKDEKLTPEEIDKLDGAPKLKEFLESTRMIPYPKNIRPFIYFKQSEEELGIPDVEDLEIALYNKKQEIVNEKFALALKSPELLKKYESFIISRMEENKSRTFPLSNIVVSSLKALKESSLEFSKIDYYNKVAGFLGRELANQLYLINPSLVFDQIIDRCNRHLKSKILSQYIEILSTQSDEKKTFRVKDEWAYELFQKIVAREDLFKAKKEDISKAIYETYFSNIEILSLFKDKEDVQKDFISEELLSKFISILSEDDIENKDILNNKIQLLLNLKNVVTPNIIQELINKFSELLKNENQKPLREEKENLLNNYEITFDAYQEHITKIDDKNVLVTLKDAAIEGINAIRDRNQKKIFIPTCVRLKDLLPDPAKADINNSIMDFWNNTSSEGFEFVLNKLGEDIKQKVIGEYWHIFQSKSEQQEEIFNTIWQFLKKENMLHLLKHVIGSGNYNWALSKLEESFYKIDLDKREVISMLLDRVDGVQIQDRPRFYKLINTLKCARDAKLKEKLAEQIRVLLANGDFLNQEIGYNALREATYLSQTLRRNVTREILNWLKQLSPINHTHQHSIRSVILNWEILPLPPKSDYIDIIFDKLLKSSSDINDVRLGLEIVQKIKPKYKENKPYFDDVLDRIEKEENEDIKTEIKNGLLKIKPIKFNKYNKDFWKRLEKI